MQAFAIIEWLVQLDGIHSGPQILDIDVPEPVQLHPDRSVHRVVGMAGVARFVERDAMILKMRRRDMILVVDKKAPPIGFHDVARKTEIGLLRALEMLG